MHREMISNRSDASSGLLPAHLRRRGRSRGRAACSHRRVGDRTRPPCSTRALERCAAVKGRLEAGPSACPGFVRSVRSSATRGSIVAVRNVPLGRVRPHGRTPPVLALSARARPLAVEEGVVLAEGMQRDS